MILTNKAKELFEDWYLSNIGKLRSRSYDKLMMYQFYDIPLSMKWGVYLEFADSLGYYVYTKSYQRQTIWQCHVDYLDTIKCATRQEAQIEAIKKLNEIINKKFAD